LAASFFGGNVGLLPTTAPGKEAYLTRRFGFGTEAAIFSACSAAARAKVAAASARSASVPIPKFARVCRTLRSELRNRRTLATLYILVPL